MFVLVWTRYLGTCPLRRLDPIARIVLILIFSQMFSSCSAHMKSNQAVSALLLRCYRHYTHLSGGVLDGNCLRLSFLLSAAGSGHVHTPASDDVREIQQVCAGLRDGFLAIASCAP